MSVIARFSKRGDNKEVLEIAYFSIILENNK